MDVLALDPAWAHVSHGFDASMSFGLKWQLHAFSTQPYVLQVNDLAARSTFLSIGERVTIWSWFSVERRRLDLDF